MSISLCFLSAISFGSFIFSGTNGLSMQHDWKTEVKEMKTSSMDTYLSPSSIDSVMNAISASVENQMFFFLDSADKGRPSHTPLEEYKTLKEKGVKLTLLKYPNKGQNRSYENLFLLFVK